MEADQIPTDIIIYAVIAVVLIVWLGRILGTRQGSERQRPNPFTLPQAPAEAMHYVEPAVRLKNLPASVDAGLVQIALSDRSFDPARFIENAKDAFTIVVTAFAEGDRATLKDLLAPGVYQSFDAVIADREKTGKKVSTEIHGIDEANIIEARMDKSKALITIRFRAEETYVETDANGKVIAGNPDKIVTMTDVWVFTRDTKSKDARWFLAETRDDIKEDEGRKIPEAGITA